MYQSFGCRTHSCMCCIIFRVISGQSKKIYLPFCIKLLSCLKLKWLIEIQKLQRQLVTWHENCSGFNVFLWSCPNNDCNHSVTVWTCNFFIINFGKSITFPGDHWCINVVWTLLVPTLLTLSIIVLFEKKKKISLAGSLSSWHYHEVRGGAEGEVRRGSSSEWQKPEDSGVNGWKRTIDSMPWGLGVASF